jgi:hypothetical protein
MVWTNQAAVFHIALNVFVKLPEPATPICFQHCRLCVFSATHHHNLNLKVNTVIPLAAVEPGLRAEGKNWALPMMLCF